MKHLNPELELRTNLGLAVGIASVLWEETPKGTYLSGEGEILIKELGEVVRNEIVKRLEEAYAICAVEAERAIENRRNYMESGEPISFGAASARAAELKALDIADQIRYLIEREKTRD